MLILDGGFFQKLCQVDHKRACLLGAFQLGDAAVYAEAKFSRVSRNVNVLPWLSYGIKIAADLHVCLLSSGACLTVHNINRL